MPNSFERASEESEHRPVRFPMQWQLSSFGELIQEVQHDDWYSSHVIKFLLVNREREYFTLLCNVLGLTPTAVEKYLPKLEENNLVNRVEHIENVLFHGVQPVINKISPQIEKYVQKDSRPGAGSARYEWWQGVSQLKNTLEKLRASYHDLGDRLAWHTQLLDKARTLLRIARSTNNNYRVQAVLTIHDALCSVRSEDLTLEQTELVAKVIESLEMFNWTRDMVRELDKSLLEFGFETVPSDQTVSGLGIAI